MDKGATGVYSSPPLTPTPCLPKTTSLSQQQEQQHSPVQSVSSFDASTLNRPFPSPAHDWYSGGSLRMDDTYFRDQYGRALLLRGVNLCGNSKLPIKGASSSHKNEDFFEHRSVSFVGRPFPLNEVDEHLGRLKAWGLTFVRLLCPWESLEHGGPGIYDEEFIDYLVQVIKAMPKYGIRCFIDPHQDCYSRYSGGSGAPGWTFEVANLDIRSFKETGAAYVHNVNCTVGDHLPMVWPTSYNKLASSTMFTIFWAGETFLPRLKYGPRGESAQEFLQRHYIECYVHLAERIVKEGLEAVVGFEVMNEPHQGYIGLRDLEKFDMRRTLIFGDSPSAVQSFALGDGIPQEVEVWVKSWPYPTRKASMRWLNTGKKSAWLPNPSYTNENSGSSRCLWRAHGLWDVDVDGKLVVLKPDYFCVHPLTKEPVSFEQDFYLPFVNRFSRSIRKVMKDAFVFVEPLPNEAPPIWSSEDQHDGIVYAPHWYDLKSIFAKSFDGRFTHDVQALSKGTNVLSATYFGLKGARRNYEGQVANVVRKGLSNVGRKPCLIGECGIPMDINDRAAFENNDFTHHTNFLDAVITAMETNLVHFTLWNYNASNDTVHGDHWYGEDFSIYSSPRFARKNSKISRTSTLRESESPQGTATTKNASDAEKQVTVIAETQARNRKANSTRNKKGITVSISSRPEDAADKSPSDDEMVSPVSPFDLNMAHFGELDPDYHHHFGGRVLDAVVRPYAAKIAGIPLATSFNLQTSDFYLEFQNPVTDATTQVNSEQCSKERKPRPRPRSRSRSRSRSRRLSAARGRRWKASETENTIEEEGAYLTPTSGEEADDRPLKMEGNAPGSHVPPYERSETSFVTEIFVPNYHYGHETLDVHVTDGEYTYHREEQTLLYRYRNETPGFRHVVRIGVVDRSDSEAAHSHEEVSPGAEVTVSAGSHHHKVRRDHYVHSPAHKGPIMGSTTSLKQRRISVEHSPTRHAHHGIRYKAAAEYYENRRRRAKQRMATKRSKRCCKNLELCNIL